MEQWHALPYKKALNLLGSDAKSGLSQHEAKNRLAHYGRNEIESGKKISALALLLEQFTNPLVIILIMAACVSFFFEKGIDALLIIAIVVLNGLFGFVQNYNAEKSIEALKKLGAANALVARDKIFQEIGAGELVPGDIVLLREGSKVPADCRLIEASGLNCDESILTGESAQSEKGTEPSAASAALSDRKCMAYMDTLVVAGNAKAIVVATGKETEIGKIAKSLEEIKDEPTRFHVEIDGLSDVIGKAIFVLVIIVAATMLLLHNAKPIEALVLSISLAVAAIPEGLPAVVTISLALATRKMLKKNTLVRKLPVLESLGSVEVICTDKTGTLTENSMVVSEIYCNGKKYSLTGSAMEAKGSFLEGDSKAHEAELKEILLCGAAANNSIINQASKDSGFKGDPTEIALMVSALKAGVSTGTMLRIGEMPFSSQRKRMTAIFKCNGGKVAYSKGAPEIILESCSSIMKNGRMTRLSEKGKREILLQNSAMASKALRVIGFAKKELKGKNEPPESGMVFLGLQGMLDPPRKEVAEAIRIAKAAGIRVVLLTGDNRLTAEAISKQIGLEGKVIDGPSLERLLKSEFEKACIDYNVFARMSPDHKFSVLKELKRQGLSVAMTGDGVNDAPALKEADVGIAMGVRGSDVAKEASDIIILDDNFATIVEAVRQGRGIFDNIQKFVFFLLTQNLAEVMVVFIASLFRQLALTPVMLLWINLVTDGLPALALGTDPPNHLAMQQPPRKKGEQIINKEKAMMMLAIGAIITTAILGLFFYHLPKGIILAQTVAFSALVFYELFMIVAIKRQEGSSIFANKWLAISLVVSLLMQLLLLYTPASAWFGVARLGIEEWLAIAAGGVAVFLLSTIAMSVLGRKGKE